MYVVSYTLHYVYRTKFTITRVRFFVSKIAQWGLNYFEVFFLIPTYLVHIYNLPLFKFS